MPTLVGIPFDAASSYMRGPALAPPAIRVALRSPSSNSWTESLVDIAAAGVLDDVGDIEIGNDPRDAIEHGIARMLSDGRTPLILGGDHSITYPVLRAFGAQRREALTILHIDAHADLYDEFEGDRYSHACPFARIMEEGLATRLVQVGIRTLTEHQRQQADRFGVEVIDMRRWADGARPIVSGAVYLSLDLDALDPAFAPGVSHWEPGGLSVRDVIGIIQALDGVLVGADVVEYNPTRDQSGITAMVAAKLVKEITARMVASGDAGGGLPVGG